MPTSAASPQQQAESLRVLWGHDVSFWKAKADACVLLFLVVAALAATIIAIGSILSSRWGDEIIRFKDRQLERQRVQTQREVAQAGIAAFQATAQSYVAGEEAGRAQLSADQASIALEAQKALTAKYILEAEKLRSQLAWRELDGAQMTILVRVLSQHPLTLVLEHVGLDPESTALWRQISEACIRAGLEVRNGGAIVDARTDPKTGITITGSQGEVEWMASAFAQAGLPSTKVIQPGVLDVYVGSKPRPY